MTDTTVEGEDGESLAKMKKCIVMGCKNYQGEGGFVDRLCSPCYQMLVTGIVLPSNITFIGEIKRNLLELKRKVELLAQTAEKIHQESNAKFP